MCTFYGPAEIFRRLIFFLLHNLDLILYSVIVGYWITTVRTCCPSSVSTAVTE